MAEIYKEGRVVGLSAYEQYVKQYIANRAAGDTTEPATEREWLASTIAEGSSLVLKVPGGQGTQVDATHYVLDIPLPTNTKLRAANTIFASWFDGQGKFDSSSTIFPVAVSNYSWLIANTGTTYPSGNISDPSTLAYSNPASSTTSQQIMNNYFKITDGVILQAGTWTKINTSAPASDFSPDLSKPPVLRLCLSSLITVGYEPYVILTGLTLNTVISGISGLDTSLDTNAPQDGDFLGPAVFPWAAKVIFSLPSVYAAYVGSTNITTSNITYNNPITGTAGTAKVTEVSTGAIQGKALSMTGSTAGTGQYTVSQNPVNTYPASATVSRDNITWALLLQALADDRGIDILGTDLKSAKVTLGNNNGGYITFKTGTGDAIRLYVCKTSPGQDDGQIPNGSIGIGWN